MSSGDVTERPTRNAARTRGAILAAAAAAMSERGSGVSLDHIARQAGVSKSGLIHHFASREELVVALVDDAQEQLRKLVLDHLDLSENSPGKLLRAYVRAMTSGSEAILKYFTAAPTWVGIYQSTRVTEMAAAGAKWWDENLAADGMPANRIFIVRRAAEGLAAAVAYGDETPATAAQAGELLLRLANGEDIGSFEGQ